MWQAVHTMWNPDLCQRALRFAADAHEGQVYPGSGLPYLLHLSQVSFEVMGALAREPRDDGDVSVLCAILHDSVEDTEVTREQVVEAFGEAVAAGVQALSKDESLPKAERMPDSLRRIRAEPQAVWLVKLADRICNLQAPPHYWSKEKCARYHEEAGTILEALGEASPWLAQRLRGQMKAYAAYI